MGPKPQAQEWPEDRDEHLHWRALSDPTRRRILDLVRTNPRQQNLPVCVTQAADGVDELVPVKWSSSADIVGLANAQGMAIVAPECGLAQGEIVPYRPLETHAR